MSGDVIEWREGRYMTRTGHVGGIELFLTSWGTARRDAMWVLTTTLPIASKAIGQHYSERADAEAAAERLLSAFIERLTTAPTTQPRTPAGSTEETPS